MPDVQELIEITLVEQLTEVNVATELLEVVNTSEVLGTSEVTELVETPELVQLLASPEQTEISEIAIQGPPGPPGSDTNYPGKTLVYSSGVLAEVLLYLDAAKTQLAERRVLTYSGSVLNTISFYGGAGALTKTRTLTYSGGVLTSVTDT